MDDENNEENGTGDEGASGENQNTEGNQNEGGDGGEGGKEGAAANWYGDDWKEQLAGDDKAFLKQLGRYSTPNDFANGHKALQQKFSSGEARGELPENHTDEDLATYRKANGIPDTPEKYWDDMPEGLVIGDEDKSLFESYGQMMHDMNVDPKVAQSTAAWYYQAMETQQAEQAEVDDNQRMATEDALRVKFGDEYRAVISTMDTYFEQAPAEVLEALMGARAADGTPLMTKPDVLEFFAATARAENPFSTPVPNLSQHGGDWKEEQAALIKESADPESDYRKGPKDKDGRTKGEARLLELNRYEIRMKEQAD